MSTHDAPCEPTSITGAIFDCDGTLVDSMPMWNALVEEMFDAYGIPKTPELLAEAEAHNFDDMCYWFHESLGIGESGAQLLEETRQTVRDHYVHDIPMFDGCKRFLDELKDHGVRMLILSATTEPEVHVALAAHGLEGYFERVIQTSATGTDKEHPQAYQYALDVLGTDKDTTWVFEDAPFAVRTAHDFGLKTVCLYNDHDGRDYDFCAANCDILAHGYAELSLALLEDYARAEGQAAGVLHALVVDGSPEASSAQLVRELADQSDYVVAADRGALACREAGVVPDMFCGDSDSIDAEALAWAQDASSAQIAFPSEKYATDLSLAIACARHEASRQHKALALTITCASGGRPDHALAVLGCALNNRDAQPRVVEDHCEMRILCPEGCARWDWGVEAGATEATVSVIPLVEDTVVTEQGMRWNLSERHLAAFADEGVSNRIESTDAYVECHGGAVAAYLIR